MAREPSWRGTLIDAQREPAERTTTKRSDATARRPKRQNEPNQRFRSGLAASATRSRVFAAHGRERRGRTAELPAAA